MNAPSWERIKEIAAEALSLPSGEKRQAFLKEACAGDTELEARVREQVVALSGDDSFLATDDNTMTLPATPFSGTTDPGTRLDRLKDRDGQRYQVRSRVGAGGQGAVYEVWDEDLQRRLAMKVVLGREDAQAAGDTPPADPATLSRFLEEAQVTGQLDHPGVVPVHELGVDENGQVFFTMRLVRGDNLHEIIQKVHAGADGWTTVRALGAILKACEAIAYAHSKRVIHRDIKPSNLMVGKYGEVYAMDWGLARVLDQKDTHDLRFAEQPTTQSVQTDRRKTREAIDSPLITMDGSVVGTPSYMPPEQAKGNIEEMGPASDVYSMGAVIYQLLTGQIPFVPSDGKVSPRTVLARVLDGPPAPVPSLAPSAPAELVAICDKAMAREMPDRYADMDALAADLRAYLEGRVVSAYEAGTWAELRKWIGRNRGWSGAAAIALVALVGVLAWAIVEGGRADEQAGRAQKEAERASTEAGRAKASAIAERAAKESAVEARELAEKREEEAIEARKLAESRERETQTALAKARLLSYEANLHAASIALESSDGAELRRRLQLCPEELRGWEWGRLRISEGSLYATLSTGSAPTKVPVHPRWSPVAPTLAYVNNATVRLWSLGDQVQATLKWSDSTGGSGLGAAVASLAWSADGKLLAAADLNGSVRVWGESEKQLVYERVAEVTGRVDEWEAVQALMMARPPSDDAEWRVEVVNTQHGPVSVHAHQSLAWRPGGKILARTVGDTLVLWDSKKPDETRLQHTARLTAVAWNSDGSVVAAADLAGVTLWDADSKTLLHRLEPAPDLRSENPPLPLCGFTQLTFVGHEQFVARSLLVGEGWWRWQLPSQPGAALFGDHIESQTLAIAGQGKVARARGKEVVVQNSLSAEATQTLGEQESIISDLTWQAEGRLAAGTAAGEVLVWSKLDSTATAESLEGHSQRVYSIAWSSDGTLISSASEDGTVRIWSGELWKDHYHVDVSEAIPFQQRPRSRWLRFQAARRAGEPLSKLSWSPDSAHLVVTHQSEIRVSETRTGATVLVLSPPDPLLFLPLPPRWSSDRQEFSVWATLGERGPATRITWSVQRGAVVDRSAPRQDLSDLAWRGWATADLRNAMKKMEWQPRAFSHDGRYALLSKLREKRLWDAATQSWLSESLLADVLLLRFHPNSSSVATVSRSSSDVVLGRIEAGQLVTTQTLPGHTVVAANAISDLAWTPNGDRIATACSDGKVRVWIPAVDRPIHVISTDGPPQDLAWSPNGTLLAVLMSTGRVVVYHSNLDDIRRQLPASRQHRAVIECIDPRIDQGERRNDILAAARRRFPDLMNLEVTVDQRVAWRPTAVSKRWVTQLFEEYLLKANVLAAITEDNYYSDEIQALARKEAHQRLEPSPSYLVRRAIHLISPDSLLAPLSRGDGPITNPDSLINDATLGAQATKLARTAVALSPQDPKVVDTLAWALVVAGEYEEALATGAHLVQVGTKDSVFWTDRYEQLKSYVQRQRDAEP